ncbi:MAG: hypothetical protein JWQ68_2379 [Cryobacterium sp.]|jgi:uncharacterized protein YozE (UPF0346 family)|nr:hypothetical protein [Cryobacterium sp.]
MSETFTTWLLDQRAREDAVGGLAREIETDDMFPVDGDKPIYDGYFAGTSIDQQSRDAFERAWDEFSGVGTGGGPQ